MGAYLSQPQTAKRTQQEEDAHLAYGVSSMQGWRTSMEDAHEATLSLKGDSQFSLFAVFDGHGGCEVAQFCQAHMSNILQATPGFKDGNISRGLVEAFLEVDSLILSPEGRRELAVYAYEGRSTDDTNAPSQTRANNLNSACASTVDEKSLASHMAGLPQAGTTAVVAVTHGNLLTVANAGDSRAVLSRKGVHVDLSLDHKPTLESERSRILAAGGFVAEGRVNGSLALSRAIGDMEFKQSTDLPADKQIITAYPDINTVQLREGDEFLILACDGIW
eukprot:CAMPEP_0183789244 /NCGR_PEP_ID=MMETSP0803_2-20130417/306_1 /TAXON_ID=195967 /ORGANISM="Crustomastix stigmata, Strain CCMP3273" /LENGTH=276 /DNA_ID=CAMNT_0026033411 /DNA_START=138 /DNA_END=965 /DNA_ORIENTATION=-